MVKVFISYSRERRDTVAALAEDVRDASHEPWFDEKLTGGQRWWDSILEQIRDCDAFLYALSPDSLESEACRREFRYAQQLGKPVVPVRLSEQVMPEFLPGPLTEVHCVDYLVPGSKHAYKALERALHNLPPAAPLPDPMPAPPPVPVSYLVALRERIEAASLDQKEQIVLVFELRDKFRSGRPGAEIALLLDLLKRRDDLYAKVEREIDSVLAEIRQGGVGRPPGPDLDQARIEALVRIRDLCIRRREQLLREAADAEGKRRVDLPVPVAAGSASIEPLPPKTGPGSDSIGQPSRKKRPAGNEGPKVPHEGAKMPDGAERIPRSIRLDEAPTICERVMRRVVIGHECWVFEVDQNNSFELSLDDSEPHCIVATATLRDTVTAPSSEHLKGLEWELKEHSFAKGAAGAAAVYATGGLAALALLSKSVRDLLMTYEATRSWPVPRSGALAMPAAELALALQRVAKDAEAIGVRRKKQ